MKHILVLVLVAMVVIPAYPWHYSYKFSNTPVSHALVRLGKDNPDVGITFIYEELDSYRTSAQVDADDAYSAIRQIIGLEESTCLSHILLDTVRK